MALNDRPQVDRYSKNANRSELAIQAIFSQEHGFICRQPIPDKGCDFQIELIRGDGGATNRHIFVQVKSVEQLNLLANGQTISYNFETSRLGYLLESPAGLILIYDMATGNVYYEHVHAIVARLDSAKNSTKWREQDSVQIYIPVLNQLDESVVKEIHQHFSTIFDRLDFIHRSQASFYGIPLAEGLAPDEIDLRNPDVVKKFMLKYSGAMMNTYMVGLAIKLLNALPPGYVESEAELLLIAAVVYGEVGRHHDSENYLRKLKNREPVKEDHRHLIPFVHLKNQLMLDQISMSDFILKARELRDEVTNPQNKIVLELSIILFEQAAVQFMHPMPEDMYDRIQALSATIKENITEENSRMFLLVNNIENLAGLIRYHRFHQLNELALLELFGLKKGSQELEALSDKIARWHGQVHRELEAFYEAALKKKDKLLQASVILVRSRFVVGGEIDLASQYPMLQHLCFQSREVIWQNFVNALAGADLYESLNYFSHAHQSLCCACELLLISRGHYHYPDDVDLDQLKERKAKMERDWDLATYDFVYPDLEKLNRQRENEYGKKPAANVSGMDDTQLSGMADVIARSMRLSKQERANLLHELSTYRAFYRRCGQAYKLHRIPSVVPPREMYRQPPLYVIEHKVTGVRSRPTRNIDPLLDSWGL